MKVSMQCLWIPLRSERRPMPAPLFQGLIERRVRRSVAPVVAWASRAGAVLPDPRGITWRLAAECPIPRWRRPLSRDPLRRSEVAGAQADPGLRPRRAAVDVWCSTASARDGRCGASIAIVPEHSPANHLYRAQSRSHMARRYHRLGAGCASHRQSARSIESDRPGNIA